MPQGLNNTRQFFEQLRLNRRYFVRLWQIIESTLLHEWHDNLDAQTEIPRNQYEAHKANAYEQRRLKRRTQKSDPRY